ncbi:MULTISPECIES: nocobactin polyketide synthase NbtC [Mycobacterium]|uniref:Nocobactin polyketide synthase NbtC n=2 Tax=Mycobacterium TaxID=1763 RepID=A0ABP8RD94_9MYCO|nr:MULTISPECIES: nocobactin polyketide synthase NbtC [Mycobacterium avium complex (MAC)]ETA92102.1 polyketide synthase [Mycobacterium avium 10-5581]ASX03485.1 polyketide synthase [Mycobacterium intracellulare subsp. chimaera]PBA61269.1 polyketide synthase [Mycobacterium intracellulare subsp. chimaera]PBJ62126.1 polyketide synthase [Mycobacterium avium subsp. hominissuis]QWY63694.1 nocobactin polyketide synthase NbtC [Mycobacterium avium subsp. hominissuis]
MTVFSYQLPDTTIPVLLSSDTAELLRAEAAALRAYAATHPGITAQEIAGMLFRTRVARPHRALVMIRERDELLEALQAVAAGAEHPAVLRNHDPATARRVGYVFPGQGGQRPGMGRCYYEQAPAYRNEADRCLTAFREQFGESPADYLLHEDFSAADTAGVVQPALFVHMAGLAAMWRAVGIPPNVTVGHSQGEIAAAYISGVVPLADAVSVVGIRARAADEFATGDYAMVVIAADRDSCDALLARRPGWAQLSVVNSPNLTAVSGDRAAVQGLVDTCAERGTFARVIGVHYPAHTSLINELGDKLRASLAERLQQSAFLNSEIACLGSTLGEPIAADLPVVEYWWWNLRNTVRFDKAVAAAASLGVNTYVELSDHPALLLATEENLAALADGQAATVVGTSTRTATDLGEFTRNLARVAVQDLDYRWETLRTESEGPAPLPLPDFPNALMNQLRLWLPFEELGTRPVRDTPTSAPATQLLAEQWVRLSQRKLVAQRTIGVIDHTGVCADLAAALCRAATDIGATAQVIDAARDDLDTYVALLPPTPDLEGAEAAASVSTFFADPAWWLGASAHLTEYWLVTTSAEAVVAADTQLDLVHAAASAGFRCVGTEYPRVRFRHLDLAGTTVPDSAAGIVSALHCAEEPELALRNNALYVKRIVAGDAIAGESDAVPDHVLILGGTGNLGLEFCDHFARRGARRITLVSRSGETDAVAARLRPIRTAGTRIDVARYDIGDAAAVTSLAQQLGDAPADLIIQAAMAHSDADLPDITAERAEHALRAKAIGTSQILQSIPRTESCRIVLCSSVTATIGGRGQILYAAANRMLDAMAHRLRAEGLNCVAVQWGQWTTLDLDPPGRAKLAVTGVLPMTPTDAMAIGMAGLQHNAIVAAFDIDRVIPVLGSYGYGPLLSELSHPPAVAEAPPLAGNVSERVTSVLAQTIGVNDIGAINPGIPMVAIGLDSLQALELRRRVKEEFGYELDITELLGGATIADLLAKLGA